MTPWPVEVGSALALVSILLGGVTGAAAHERGPRPSPPARPNIVLVVADDQRWDTLAAMPIVSEALAAHGVTFTNSFVVNPECCPSRTSLLTGKYSHSTGVFTNEPPHGGLDAFDDSETIATALNDAGYTTALFGKYLNGYGHGGKFEGYVPPGWDAWSVFFAGNGYYDYRLGGRRSVQRYGRKAADYSTSVLSAKAVSFVRRARQPFFLELSLYAPHAPATPPPGRADAFEGFPWWRSPSFDERDVSDKPAYVRSSAPLTRAQARGAIRFRRRQLAAALGIDNGVYAILRALARRHILGRTIIVFTSDNGSAWGEHSLVAQSKWVPYDEAIRVPLIVRFDPVGRQHARRVGRLVLNIDIAPTLAALARVTLPDADGRSLVPFLRPTRRRSSWRRDFVVEHLAGPYQQGVPTYCAIRSERYKYVVYRTGEIELYDLVRDPHELRNIARRSSTVALRRALHARLVTSCDPPPPGLTLAPTTAEN